jgi:hypothetical protein
MIKQYDGLKLQKNFFIPDSGGDAAIDYVVRSETLRWGIE